MGVTNKLGCPHFFMRYAPSPTEGLDHRALSENEAEVEACSCSRVQKPYVYEHVNMSYLASKGYPQSIDVVCNGINTYPNDDTYPLSH